MCGRPTFAPAATYATGTQPSGLAVGDFNHDNILDLAVANHASNDVSLLFGNTDGTFGPAVNRNLLGLNGPAEIATADFNQDGKLDVLVANSPNNAMWYALGNGDSTFQTYPQGVWYWLRCHWWDGRRQHLGFQIARCRAHEA